MDTILENGLAKAIITDLGAELVSFVRKDNGCEYLWGGDKAIWSGHAPVLFPIVCAVNDGQVRIKGESYPLGNHGFARKSLFRRTSAGPTSAEFSLGATAETKAMYPFDFELAITYTLDGAALRISYRVANLGNTAMPFQIGTHPGFNCPLGGADSGLKFSDYYLEFAENETLERHFMDAANLLIPGKSEMWLEGKRRLPLTDGMFDSGAAVFKRINSRSVTLKSERSPRQVAMSWDQFPALGLWNTKRAGYVCIEPWQGLADEAGRPVEFKDKAWAIELAPGAAHEFWHRIEII